MIFGSLFGGEAFLGVFLIFCRIGGCLLIVPGFSSPRVPAQVRLLIAGGVSLAVTPLLLPLFQTKLLGQAPTETLTWIASETVTGLLIGLLGRIFVFVLETVMNAVSTMVGFGSMPGTHRICSSRRIVLMISSGRISDRFCNEVEAERLAPRPLPPPEICWL